MLALSRCNVQSRGRAWIASEGTDLREPHNVVLLHCYRNSLGLLHHILIHIGDLYLVLPEFVYPEYWHFDNELVELLLSTLNLLGRSSRGDHSEIVLLFGFCCGTATTCLKV